MGGNFLRVYGASAALYALGAVFGALVSFLLARLLGVEELGVYGSIAAAAALATTAASGGVHLHATREIAQLDLRNGAARISQLLYWSVRVLMLTSIIMGACVFVYTTWLRPGETLLAFSAAIMVVLGSFHWLAAAALRGMHRVLLGQALDIFLRPLIFSCLLLVAAQVKYSLDSVGAMWIALGAVFAVFLVGWRSIFRQLSWLNLCTYKDYDNHRWGSDSAKLSVSACLRGAEISLPVIVVGLLSTNAEAGIFRLATSIAVLIAMPMNMVSIFVAPMLSAARRSEVAGELNKLSVAASAAVFLPTFLLSALVWFAGDNVLVLVFGAEYASAWGPLLFLMLALLVDSFCGVALTLLSAVRRDGSVARILTISLCITLFGIVLLVDEFGALGGAIAVLLGSLLRSTLLALAATRFLGINSTPVHWIFVAWNFFVSGGIR